ncbi:hypothetical protein GQ464_016755 [Rhodocaloribacter litoris]|uniref:hypothetical protein n=1 Tax=Rhodocaloribacter litoris TaxID=2558931 RepID=UPI001424641D|nr:hypothetical protein [Rhodocaloribacter litoris]QXD15035.1 hypothetical protein GQ464_016755 [Rhodocaloribacter litoris]
MPGSPSRPYLLAPFPLLLLLVSACDLPSSGPDFSFSPGVRAPLIFDQTFVFMGPSATGHQALIDTTTSAFDSLFTVSETDNTVYLVQNLDDFAIGSLDGALPALNVAPVDLSVSIGELAEQRFGTAYERPLGIFTLDPAETPLPPALSEEMPVLPDPEAGEATVEVPNFLVPPKVDLVTLSDLSLASVRFTDETAGVNAFTLELINDLPEPLTAATDPSQPPRITLLQNGAVLGTAVFGFVGPGERATVHLSVAGKTFTVDALTYRLNVGAGGQVQPLLDDPGAVRLKMTLAPLRYGETRVHHIPAQSEIDISRENLLLDTGDVVFTEIVTRTGQATLHVTNTLPIDVRIDALEVRNEEAVAGFPAGSTILSLTGVDVPAGGTVGVPVNLGAVGIGTRVSVTVRASSGGTSRTVTLDAGQGLALSLDGEALIDRLVFRPNGETFTETGIIELDVRDVRFTSADDYVTLKEGLLEISDLINRMDLALERVDISLPDFRRPPYREQDTLVIHFQGSTDDPGAHKFRRLDRNEGPRHATLDLRDVRIYPRDNRLTYRIYARSETSSDVRELTATDAISASIRVREARVHDVAAFIEPFAVAVTPDGDGDGHLDVLSDADAEVTRLDELSALTEKDFDGLRFEGSAFTFNIRTNVTTDLELYAVLLGTTAAGKTVFLQGKGDYAVAAGDTLAGTFLAGGVPVRPEQMIRLPIEGAPAPGQAVTRTVVLDATNSNVDEFISALPEQVRYVGKVLVQAGGGRDVLAEPLELSAAIGAAVPLNFAGDFTFRDELEADLTDLADLTDPSKEVLFEGASLRLTYENGLPLGVDTRLEVLNDLGEVEISFPAPDKPALRLVPAVKDDAGLSAEPRSGLLEFTLSEDELRQLSRGRQIRLALTVETGEQAGSPARLRADDTLRLSLHGDFRFEVKVGGR